jgi:diketogulonate reductase-like aldo/keto reductase
MNPTRQTTLLVGDVAIPRLAFGLGSLMKWAPNHAYPLPTDSSKEVSQALSAGFRHFNTGDLYTNNESAARAIRHSGIQRQDLFFSLKLNTYASLGCRGAHSMIESTHKEMDRYGMMGYVDLLQLHFPPRGHPGNMSNREAWRVLEQLKDQKIARLIGVSNWYVRSYIVRSS